MCVTDRHDMTLAVKVQFKPQYNQPTNLLIWKQHRFLISNNNCSSRICQSFVTFKFVKLWRTKLRIFDEERTVNTDHKFDFMDASDCQHVSSQSPSRVVVPYSHHTPLHWVNRQELAQKVERVTRDHNISGHYKLWVRIPGWPTKILLIVCRMRR